MRVTEHIGTHYLVLVGWVQTEDGLVPAVAIDDGLAFKVTRSVLNPESHSRSSGAAYAGK
jgi:hypothetical protein